MRVPQHQRVGRRGTRRDRAVHPLQDGGHFTDLPASEADGHEHAHETSHHLVGVGVGGDVEAHRVVVSHPFDRVDPTQEHLGGTRLVPLAEGGEIVESDQIGCGRVHRVDVEGCRDVPIVTAAQGVAHRPIQHRVAIVTAGAAEAGIEGRRCRLDLVDRDLRAELAVQGAAERVGVEVRFKSRLDRLDGPGILAAGPKALDAIAVGYHFKTSLADGFWAILDNELAPQGYAYLLVMAGRGTVKSCMFSGFKQERMLVQRTIAAFERLVGLDIIDPVPHGGVGNFHIPSSAITGLHLHPVVGEQAGFQDFLWGFGMRYAILPGVLAARSVLQGKDYEALWRRGLEPAMSNSLVNRALFSLLGNRGWRWIPHRNQTQGWDAHRFLHSVYQPWPIKRLLLPWARGRFTSRRRNQGCDHVDCACVWC